ncbi:MAG: fluoride efflux transporter CrcB [Hyphomonadaceae bacterium]
MQNFLLVALGGALGASARYGAGLIAIQLGWAGFPWATLFVNVLGGLLMGMLAGWLAEGGPALRLLLGVGVLGGFTTFSAFSIDAIRLIESNQAGAAFAYIAASVILSIGACWAGLALVRSFA